MNLKFGNYYDYMKQQYHNTMINSRNDCRILKRNSLNIIDIWFLGAKHLNTENLAEKEIWCYMSVA